MRTNESILIVVDEYGINFKDQENVKIRYSIEQVNTLRLSLRIRGLHVRIMPGAPFLQVSSLKFKVSSFKSQSEADSRGTLCLRVVEGERNDS